MNQTGLNTKEIMERVIETARINASNGGGPFAAAVVCNGEIVSLEANSVWSDKDPTAHAEVNAIRKASEQLGTIDLSHCELYTSCEPCPMCFGAIYWAHLGAVYFAANRKDAADAGFDDDLIYREINLISNQRKISFRETGTDIKLIPFETWKANPNKNEY